MADDVVVINDGRLVTQGSLGELRQSASLVRSAAPSPLRIALEGAGGVVETPEPDTLVVRGLTLEEIGEQAFRAGVPIHELSHHGDSLEDRFFAWTGNGARDGSTRKEQS